MTRTVVNHKFRIPKLVYALLIGIFLFWVVIDASTTWYLVENHPAGINVEGNPFAKQIIFDYGWITFLLIKLGGFMCIAIVALGYAKRHQHISLVNIGLLMTLGIGIFIQLNNLQHIEALL